MYDDVTSDIVMFFPWLRSMNTLFSYIKTQTTQTHTAEPVLCCFFFRTVTHANNNNYVNKANNVNIITVL